MKQIQKKYNRTVLSNHGKYIYIKQLELYCCCLPNTVLLWRNVRHVRTFKADAKSERVKKYYVPNSLEQNNFMSKVFDNLYIYIVKFNYPPPNYGYVVATDKQKKYILFS